MAEMNNGNSSEANKNFHPEISKDQVGVELWNQREKVIQEKVRLTAFDKLDRSSEQLQIEIDNGGGYTPEKEARQHTKSILAGAGEFLKNKTPDQNIKKWEVESFKNIAEMKKNGAIDEAEYDQHLEEIRVAKGLLAESQQDVFAKLPTSRMSRAELIQPEKPMKPQQLDTTEIYGIGRLLASSQASKQIFELKQHIIEEEALDKKDKLQTALNQMNMAKLHIESFKPEHGISLDDWFVAKMKPINERADICRKREDVDGLENQMLQNEALFEARDMLSNAIRTSSEQSRQENSKASDVYYKKLGAYYRAEYASYRLGEDSAIIVGSRKPTNAEEIEINKRGSGL